MAMVPGRGPPDGAIRPGRDHAGAMDVAPHNPGRTPALFAGVDGCRTGWVVALAAAGTPAGRAGGPGSVEVRSVQVVARFAEVLALVEDGAVTTMALDMPVGLRRDRPRDCDVLTRAALGPRRASVFPAPVRAVLDATDHAEAVRRSRAACGTGISVQAWNLVPKVREVDEALRAAPPGVRARVHEAHPELAFATLLGAPARHPKRTTAGRRERLGALHRVVAAGRATARRSVPRGAAPDDVLDALVLAVRAVQWHDDGPPAVVLGEGTDEFGLPTVVRG